MNRAENACGGLVSDARRQLSMPVFIWEMEPMPEANACLPQNTLKPSDPTGSAGGDGQIGLTGSSMISMTYALSRMAGHPSGRICVLDSAGARCALTVLTNQENGTVLHETLTKWVQEHFLGVIEKDPAPLSLPDEALEEYAGGYVLTELAIFFSSSAMMRLYRHHIVGDHSSITDTPSDPYPPSWG